MRWRQCAEPAAGSTRLSKELRERLPVIGLPTGGQVFALAGGKPDMVEDEFSRGALVDEFEPGQGIRAGIPLDDAPGLHNALAGQQLDLPAHDISAVNGE